MLVALAALGLVTLTQEVRSPVPVAVVVGERQPLEPVAQEVAALGLQALVLRPVAQPTLVGVAEARQIIVARFLALAVPAS